MTNVFTRKSIERAWASRISSLLDTPVTTFHHMSVPSVNYSNRKGFHLSSLLEKVRQVSHATSSIAPKETKGDLQWSWGITQHYSESAMESPMNSIKWESFEKRWTGSREQSPRPSDPPTCSTGNAVLTQCTLALFLTFTDENLPPQRKSVTVCIIYQKHVYQIGDCQHSQVLEPFGSKIARALLGGHALSIAKAVLDQDDIKEAIITVLLGKINDESLISVRKPLFHLSVQFQLVSWQASNGRVWWPIFKIRLLFFSQSCTASHLEMTGEMQQR